MVLSNIVQYLQYILQYLQYILQYLLIYCTTMMQHVIPELSMFHPESWSDDD